MAFQIMGGDPLLKLIAVDWFKVDEAIDKVALHPRCLVQVLILVFFHSGLGDLWETQLDKSLYCPVYYALWSIFFLKFLLFLLL